MKENHTFKTISAACRYNSGKHFLDSGGESGRAWQRPPIEEGLHGVSLDLWKNEVSASLETAHFLASQTRVNQELADEFFAWAVDEEDSWFELVPRFMEEKGFTQYARDNTYNGENDLSQNYVWEVWSSEDQGDWLYNDEAVMVAYIHTGADIRGGYSSPLFLRSKTDYSIPIDLLAGFYALEGRDSEGEELTQEELHNLCESWQVGYSSNPSYELSKQIERIFHYTEKGASFIAKLKSGELVRIEATAPCN